MIYVHGPYDEFIFVRGFISLTEITIIGAENHEPNSQARQFRYDEWEKKVSLNKPEKSKCPYDQFKLRRVRSNS